MFADAATASVISGKSWASLAAREFGIKTMVVELSDQVIEAIKEAQRKQDIRIVEEFESEVREI